MFEELWHIRAELGAFYSKLVQSTEQYKIEVNNLKQQIIDKDKEIAELKQKLNEQSSK